MVPTLMICILLYSPFLTSAQSSQGKFEEASISQSFWTPSNTYSGIRSIMACAAKALSQNQCQFKFDPAERSCEIGITLMDTSGNGPTIDIHSKVGSTWNTWSAWSTCSVTNGTGIITRSRTCPDSCCQGQADTIEPCYINIVDGGWSSYTTTGSCSVTCGNGTQSISRTCTNPSPSPGGANCIGNSTGTQICTTGVACTCYTPLTGSCVHTWIYQGVTYDGCAYPFSDRPWCATAVNGSGYFNGSPMDFQYCSSSCTPGTCFTDSSRPCTFPWIWNGTTYNECTSDGSDRPWCATSVNGTGYFEAGAWDYCLSGCPGVPGWSNYSTFGSCSVTCGNGTQSRYRSCNNPAPVGNGTNCTGNATDTQICSTGVLCPIDGGWSNFTAFGSCSATCGNGTQSTYRNCTNPPPSSGGANCTGNSTGTQNCTTGVECPCYTSLNGTCMHFWTHPYNGVTYNGCAYPFSDRPWCAIKVNASGYVNLYSSDWQYCSLDCTPGTCFTASRPCTFPFTSDSNGFKYNNCVPNANTPWCATSVNATGYFVNGHNTWDYCLPGCPGV